VKEREVFIDTTEVGWLSVQCFCTLEGDIVVGGSDLGIMAGCRQLRLMVQFILGLMCVMKA
jgi:hypothetical protein